MDEKAPHSACSIILLNPLMGMKSSSVQTMVQSEAARQGVPVGLALAVAKHESGFKCNLIGRAGERGVMQIKPSTARGIGYRGSSVGLSNCATGIHWGMIYLRMAYRKAGGNTYRTAILYNGGLGSKKTRSSYAEALHKKTHVKATRKATKRIIGVHDFGRDRGR